HGLRGLGRGDRARVGAADAHGRRRRGIHAARRHDPLHEARCAPGIRDQPGRRAARGARPQLAAAQARGAGSGRERRPVSSMRSFRDISIKRKVIAISLLSSGAALLLACGGFLAYELRAYREATLNQLTSVAGVIAANSASAISFDDPESAEHTLSALRSERMVVAACIFGADERLFAAYYKSGREERRALSCRSEREGPSAALDVTLPMSAEGDAIGTIVIRSRPIDLYERLVRYGGILGLVMLFSGLASLPLASKLQRFISDPILQLVETSRRVSADKD